MFMTGAYPMRFQCDQRGVLRRHPFAPGQDAGPQMLKLRDMLRAVVGRRADELIAAPVNLFTFFSFLVESSAQGDEWGDRLHRQMCIRMGELLDQTVMMCRVNCGATHDTAFELDETSEDVVHCYADRVQACLRYWHAGLVQADLHASCPCSVTVDATRVGGRSIQSAGLVWPSNIGMQLPLQAPLVGHLPQVV